MTFLDPSVTLTTRQEAFCRHFTASGNAADAARRAGYALRSARQTGCALLERPYIVERIRRIRMSWRRTERDEARIALARLEQAWDAAAASGSAYLMLQIVRLQAEIAGLTAPERRARLWPLPGEDEFGEIEAGEALQAGTEPGLLADAVRSGHARAERALARHRESRGAAEAQESFDEADDDAERLAIAVQEREHLPARLQPPETGEDRPLADDPPEDLYDPERLPDDQGEDERPEDDRADGAECDWLFQRRSGLAGLHDPWTPDNLKRRNRNDHAWQQAPDHPISMTEHDISAPNTALSALPSS